MEEESNYEQLRQKGLLLSQLFAGENEQVAAQLKGIDDYLLSLMKPKNMDAGTPDNYLVRLQHEFETVCAALQDFGVQDPHLLTAFRFYNRIQYYEKKHRPRK